MQSQNLSRAKVRAHLVYHNFKPTTYMQTFIDHAELNHWLHVAKDYPYKITTDPEHSKFSAVITQQHLQQTIDTALNHYQKTTKNAGNTNVIHKMKLTFPQNNRVLFMGDFHSDMHSLLNNLKYLRHKNILSNDLRLKQEYKLIFLGDLVDRNYYGVECVYFAFQLKIHNPNNVYILNGNHEDPDTFTRYNFKNEIRSNINAKPYIEKLLRIMHLLPIVLLFKFSNLNGYYYCCHGGFSNDRNAMNGFVNGSSVFRKNRSTYGQNWSDFTCTQAGISASSRGPGIYKFGTEATAKYMKNHNINAVFRGHQDMYSLTFLTREVTHPVNYDTYEEKPLKDDLVDVWRDGFFSNDKNPMIHNTKVIPASKREKKDILLTLHSNNFSREFLPVFTTSSAAAKSDFTHTCILELSNTLSGPRLNRQNAFKKQPPKPELNPLYNRPKTRSRSYAVNYGKKVLLKQP